MGHKVFAARHSDLSEKVRDEAETLRAQLDFVKRKLRPMGKAIVEFFRDRLPDRKPGARQNG